MSQSATWDALQLARDARLCDRPEVEAVLRDEAERDIAVYVCCSNLRYHDRYDQPIDLLEWCEHRGWAYSTPSLDSPNGPGGWPGRSDGEREAVRAWIRVRMPLLAGDR